MELDGGYERPRVRPTPRRRPQGVPRLRPNAPLAVEALEVYERNGDGHTISRHCGSGPALEAERLRRYRELPATGSFPDVATAQGSVEAAVAANRNNAYRSGFAVVTAYPVRHDPPTHTLPTPPLPGGVPVCDGPGVRTGCDDATLRGRLRRDPAVRAASSFRDRAVAALAVRRAIEAAGADVDDWLLCEHRPRMTIDAWIGAFLGVVLTREAYRRRHGSLPAHSVHVVLHRSLIRPWGFNVAAAYPRLP
jgi:hypothetical protein